MKAAQIHNGMSYVQRPRYHYARQFEYPNVQAHHLEWIENLQCFPVGIQYSHAGGECNYSAQFGQVMNGEESLHFIFERVAQIFLSMSS